MRALLWLALVGCSGTPVAGPAATCPATFAAASSARVTKAPASCPYPEGVCTFESPCSGVRHDAPLAPVWTCKVFPVGCPAAPAEGATCPQLGMRCEYMRASSCGGSVAICEDTGWVFETIEKAG